RSGALEDRIYAAMNEMGRFAPDDLSRAALRLWLQQGRIVVVFSQLEDSQAMSRAILEAHRLVELFPQSRVLMTLSLSKMSNFDLPTTNLWRICEFSSQIARNWLVKNTGDQQSPRPALVELAKDPL